MHRVILYFASAVTLIWLAWGTQSLAQGGWPTGSYRATCQNVSINGNMLNARCQKVDGGWNNTSINFRNCQGNEIINDNGNLRCGGAGWGQSGTSNVGGWRGGLPPGDYRKTCRDVRMNGNTLNATCQKVDGGWNATSLRNVNQCRSPIVNDDGNLRCPR